MCQVVRRLLRQPLVLVLHGLRKVVAAGGGSWSGASIVAIGTPDITPYALKAANARPDYITFSTGQSTVDFSSASGSQQSGTYHARGGNDDNAIITWTDNGD